jgi:uncharacterized protein (DUF934 family)
MRRILRRREVVPAGDFVAGRSVIADEWRLYGEDATDADAVIVPLAELRRDTAKWLTRPGRVGILVAPPENVESLADVVAQVALVAIEFPGIGDGRGFSHARLLRDRLKFKGELRAVGGGVKQDKIFLMARCGFDSFELPETENADEALAAFRRYDVVYQPGEPLEGVRRQRFFA